MDEIGTGKDEIRTKLGQERTSLDGKDGCDLKRQKQPWCNGALTCEVLLFIKVVHIPDTHAVL